MLTGEGSRARKSHSVAAALAALLCALIGFAALPALAMATSSVVNSTADEPDETAGAGSCNTPAGECTLRAAIETANSDAGADVITFDHTVFEGVFGSDEIHLTVAALPRIQHPVAIRGGHCGTTPNFKPCAGVVGFSGAIFMVEAEDVEISGLALFTGNAGIEVEGATGFVAAGDWLGIKLNGGEGIFGKADLILGPGADEATIGSAVNVAENRNVIGGDTKFGLLVRGASKAKIEGNYIGVATDGQTPAPIEFGVRVVDEGGVTPDPAENDEIGGARTAKAGTFECGGACNVIAGTGDAIDLASRSAEGTAPATGPTQISGNFIGLGAEGLAPVVSGPPVEAGIWAGKVGGASGAGHLTVGGPSKAEANFIIGAETGISASSAPRFRALGNVIGMNAKEEDVAPAHEAGIAVESASGAEAAEILSNRLALGVDGIGIENDGRGAVIAANRVEGASTGIRLEGADGGHGNTVAGNALISPDVEGIYIEQENDDNVLTGNYIFGARKNGIVIEHGAVGNRIGGDTPLEENVLEGIGTGNEAREEGTIKIYGEPFDYNEVAGNHGAGNALPFIQLSPQGPDPENTPNGSIKPPVISSALLSSASGTAQPGATVRVFTKATTAAGELQPEVAVATADVSGNWSTIYPTVPVGTLVAATQTLNGGTSEVSAPGTALFDPSAKVEPVTHPSPTMTTTPSSPTAPAPSTAPTVKITKGPAKTSKSTKATFKFTASIAAAKFECKLDGKKWAACKSPKTYKGLKPGRHTFRVRAVANTVTGPAVQAKFTIKP